MKKLLSLLITAAMLVSSVAVFADDEETGSVDTNTEVTDTVVKAPEKTTVVDENYVDFLSNANNWSFTTSNSDDTYNVSYDSSSIVAKSGSWRGTDAAIYTGDVISGDSVFRMNINSLNYNGTGNVIRVDIYGMRFEFDGKGRVTYYANASGSKTGVSDAEENSNYKAGARIIKYETSGSIEVYRANDTEGTKLLYSYTGEDIANREVGDKVTITFLNTPGSINDIKMYKEFESYYAEDFSNAEAAASDWDLTGYKIVQKDTAGRTGLVPSEQGSSSQSAYALLTSLYTTGSYVLTADFENTHNMPKFIYLNRNSVKNCYAVRIYGQGTEETLSVCQGDEGTKLVNTDGVDSVAVGEQIDTIKIVYDQTKSTITVYINGKTEPSTTIENATYATCGYIGVGSRWMVNQASFNNIKLTSGTEKYEIADLALDGEVTSDATLTATATATNTTNVDKSAVVATVLYKNDALEKVNFTNCAIPANVGQTTISNELSLGELEGDSTYFVKAMLLDSWTTLRPLLPAITK